MKRREFFSRFIPKRSQAEGGSGPVQREEDAQKPPMTENERFLRAMALGIDPATVTPGQLETLIPESEPSTRQK